MLFGNQKINVYSIFTTINGEIGRSGQGSWATFIRLAGCNLRCNWCDTRYAQEEDSGREMSLNEVLFKVKSCKCKNITITGGEPLLQRKPFTSLVNQLLIEDYLVSVETNGSIPLIPRREMCIIKNDVSWVVDYKPPSAGVEKPFCVENLDHLGVKDYLKFVINEDGDYKAVFNILKGKEIEGHSIRANVVVSPVLNSSFPPEKLYDRMHLDGLYDVPISIQIHKLIPLKEPS